MICKQLLAMHHQPNPDCANQWEVGIGWMDGWMNDEWLGGWVG